MLRVEVLALLVTLPALAQAETVESRTAVMAESGELLPAMDRPTAFSELPLDVAKPSRSARLLTESAVVLGGGVVLPFTAYAGFTALQSFVGFFGGFLSATIIGAVLAPIAVIVAGHLLGAEGGTGRSVIGALLGLVVGLLVGLPLATLPGAGYLVGLGLLWALPSVGTLIAFEWGRAEPPPTGAVVFRF